MINRSGTMAEAAAKHPPGPDSYIWHPPGKPVSVHLSLTVVDRIERHVLESFRSVTKRGSEIGGLLLGTVSSPGRPVVTVSDYELIACDYARGPLYILGERDRDRLAEALERRSGAVDYETSVVGWFRSNTRRDLALEEEDLAVIGDFFADRDNVFLLVKPFAMKPSVAGFFIWEGGQIRREASYAQFPFKRSELIKAEFTKSILGDTGKVVETPPPAPAPYRSEENHPAAHSRLSRESHPPASAPPAMPDHGQRAEHGPQPAEEPVQPFAAGEEKPPVSDSPIHEGWFSRPSFRSPAVPQRGMPAPPEPRRVVDGTELDAGKPPAVVEDPLRTDAARFLEPSRQAAVEPPLAPVTPSVAQTPAVAEAHLPVPPPAGAEPVAIPLTVPPKGEPTLPAEPRLPGPPVAEPVPVTVALPATQAPPPMAGPRLPLPPPVAEPAPVVVAPPATQEPPPVAEPRLPLPPSMAESQPVLESALQVVPEPAVPPGLPSSTEPRPAETSPSPARKVAKTAAAGEGPVPASPSSSGAPPAVPPEPVAERLAPVPVPTAADRPAAETPLTAGVRDSVPTAPPSEVKAQAAETSGAPASFALTAPKLLISEQAPDDRPFRIAGLRPTWLVLAAAVVAAVAVIVFLWWPQPSPPSLGLKIERRGGQILLTWDRESNLIKAAQRAILSITDGEHKEDVDLDLGQLRNGSIVYTSITGDVSFRLEVTNFKEGKSTTESVRVLAGRGAAPSPAPSVAEDNRPLMPPPAKAMAGPAAPSQPPAAQQRKPAAATEPGVPEPEAPASSESLAARLSPPPRTTTPVAEPEPPPAVAGGNVALALPVSTAPKPSAGPPAPSPPSPAAQRLVVQSPAPSAQAASQPQPASSEAAATRPQTPPSPPQNAPAVPAATAPSVGGNIQEAALLRRLTPVYPLIASRARVEGTVRVEATIGRDGRVAQAKALSGPPLLRQAAADSVRQWIYAPAKLNGQPVESNTVVDVVFSLSR